MASILDGKQVARKIRDSVSEKIQSLPNKPVLAIILATDNQSTLSYVEMIQKSSDKSGIQADIVNLGKDASSEELANKVKKLADDKNIHGIIIQTPLPEGVDADKARSLIPLEKDIDGANPLSAGRLLAGLPAFAPATAQAVIEILKSYEISPAGKHAVVIGRSRIIGKPVADLLIGLDATVTVCHSKTINLPHYTKSADVLVVAAGKAKLIDKEYIDESKQTVVIDVGTNFDKDGNVAGDVNFEDVQELAGSITPVPGGVGPVTTAVLLKNTLEAYLQQAEN